MHTDIKSGDWIDRILPLGLRPYARLARLDRPIGWWLLLLPSWWAILLASGGVSTLGPEGAVDLCLFWIGAIVMRAAGCVINDLWDRDLDRHVARTAARPLASGAVSRARAFAFLGALLLCGAIILFQLSLLAILLGLLSLPLIVVYPLMKRWIWWPQIVLGLTFNFGALIGWAAATMSVGLPALLLYLGGVFWTLSYDTVYAHQDLEDDMTIGIKSSARWLGDPARAKKWVGAFMLCAWALIAFADQLAAPGVFSAFLMAPSAAHLFWQWRRWDPADHESSLRIFRSNRDFGLLVLPAMMI